MKTPFRRFLLPLLLLTAGFPVTSPAADKPNVLFIAIDDLNDWVGPLKGHPQVKTPNLDRLAARGTTFANAHCQAPLCNPSRASVMTGLRPTTTGVYGLAPWFREIEAFKDRVTLPQHFAANGYRTLSTGKIFHGGYGRRADDSEFQVLGPAMSVGARPEQKLIPPTPNGDHPLMDWGTFPHEDEDRGDWAVATWAVEQLESADADEPFFLAAGFFLPHVPCYAPPKWFDLYPEAGLEPPPLLRSDRDDTPMFSWYLNWKLPEPRLSWCEENDAWMSLVRSYLASISYVDHQVGRLLDALEAGGHADDTIVVLWSDHGYHLGEKLITGKNTLWERSTRVPLIFAGPGIAEGATVTSPAELLDLYPTLSELCGLPVVPGLEGRSLAPQLEDATAPRPYPAITSHNQGNHTVRSMRYRFIQYADGTEEFYDHRNDPDEWHNLANDPDQAALMAEHRQWLPKVDVPAATGSRHRVLTYDPATSTAVWEGEVVEHSDWQR